MTAPVLDLDDVQGNVLAGFNTDFQVFIALTLSPGQAYLLGARWVGVLAESVATTTDVRKGRQNMRGLQAGHSAPWLAVAVSQRLIESAQPGVALNDAGFRQGMVARAASALGDRTDPASWRVGGSAAPVDVLLTVASNDEASAAKRAGELIADASQAGLACRYRETGQRLAGDREHFGFRDGLSQPRLKGDDPEPDTWPGFFLFGYPKFEGGPPHFDAKDPIGFTRNGSLVVLRRLVQNVSDFDMFCKAEAARLSSIWPELTGPWLAALIVGRWPSGAPVSTRVPHDPGPGPGDNAFDFHDDPEGGVCPFGAHIRKVNPRKGPRDEVVIPRLLRRGIPFRKAAADATDAERGLLFLAYQTSIKDQFEFLTKQWMNNPTRPQASAGHDLLVGRASSARTLAITGPNGRVTVEHDLEPWITPTGGAYLFAPGRRGLAMLREPSRSVVRFQILTHAFALETANLTPRALPERDGSTTIAMSGPTRGLSSIAWPLTRITVGAAAELHRLTAVERLDLHGIDFPTQMLGAAEVRRLAEEPALTHVALNGVDVPGDSLTSALSRMPRLSEADLRGLDLTDSHVAAIADAQPRLTELFLGSIPANNRGHRFETGRLTAVVLAKAARLPRLRSLGLRGIAVDDTSLLAQAAMLHRLEELDLGETDAGDGVAGQLASRGSVRRLALDRTRLTDEGAVALAHARGLDDLDVSWTEVGGPGVRALWNRGRFRRLVLAGLNIGDLSLDQIGSAEELRDVDLSRTGVGDRTASVLSTLPHLECLRVAGTSLTSQGVAALANSSVRALDIRGIRVDASAVRAISRMSRLRELRLGLNDAWDQLQDSGAALYLDAMAPRGRPVPPGLRELRMLDSLDAESCRALGNLTGLESLEVIAGAENLGEIGEASFRALRTFVAEAAGVDDLTLDRLGGLPRLEALFISNNPIAVSVARLDAPYLHTLELRNTATDDRAIESIARLPRLHCVDLPGTRVTPAGISALVRGAQNLQSLALDSTQITPQSIEALGASPTLLELYLYGASVTDATVALIISLQRLRELVLVGTTVTDVSVPYLVSLAGLRTLRVDRNNLSVRARASLRAERPDLAVHAPPTLGGPSGAPNLRDRRRT